MSKPVVSLLLSLLALGYGEYYNLILLKWTGFVLSIIVALILFFVLVGYTVDQWKSLVCPKDANEKE